MGKALAASSIAFDRLGLAAELHEERAPVGDRVHLRRTWQRGGAIVGRERRLELAHRLTDLTDGVVRLRAFRRREGCALRRVQRLVQPVELLQRQRPRGERARMPRREGEQARRAPAERQRGGGAQCARRRD